MADVSQVVQMQRLRASPAQFLANSKAKNTSSSSFQSYLYLRGIHSKAAIPGGYVFGDTPLKTRNRPPFSFTYDGGQPGAQTNSDTIDGGLTVNIPPSLRTADGGPA